MIKNVHHLVQLVYIFLNIKIYITCFRPNSTNKNDDAEKVSPPSIELRNKIDSQDKSVNLDDSDLNEINYASLDLDSYSNNQRSENAIDSDSNTNLKTISNPIADYTINNDLDIQIKTRNLNSRSNSEPSNAGLYSEQLNIDLHLESSNVDLHLEPSNVDLYPELSNDLNSEPSNVDLRDLKNIENIG